MHQVNHDVARVFQCSVGDSVTGFAYCSITMIQNILLSGWAFNKLFAFGEFVAEISFVKVTEDNN